MQKQKIKEVGISREGGIGSIPLGDKVNELSRVINLLLAERSGPLLTWEISQSEIEMERWEKKKKRLEKKEIK